jgi:CO/xanthine dehydrogenase Mo-binding subunit
MSGATPSTSAPARPLPGNLQTNPRLSKWLRFRPDGIVEISPGKVEIGQGILTALTQIAADELDVGIERVRVVTATTTQSPNEGVTSGSLSVQDSGMALRYACAEARAIYLAAAAERLGVPVEALGVADGTMEGPGNARTSYWELAGEGLLERDATAAVPAKAIASRRVAGRSIARVDAPAKIYGQPSFVHDITLPDMLHGCVLKPPRPQATLTALEETAARACPGVVAVVRDGNFAGLIAQSIDAARTGLEELRIGATWSAGVPLPDETDLRSWLKSQPVETTEVSVKGDPAASPTARTIRREYSRPFIAHASMSPSCAIAQWTDAGLRVWTHSQGIFNLRADLAIVLSMPVENIIVEHHEGAGCYGQNGADDVALDAVLLARAAGGRPVRLEWAREDELTSGPLGAAMAVDIAADLDAAGEVVAWRHDVWSNGHVSRPGRAKTPTLSAASQLARPFERFISVNPPLAGGGGAERNSVPGYDFPAWQITSHRLLTMPIRTSSLRTLGAFANVFAIESFVDELASLRGEDPLAYRLRHLPDARARAVLQAAADGARWGTWRKRDDHGHGIAFARYKGFGAYCAVVAEVEGEADIRVRRLVIAVDVGEAINPDGVANQIEGGAIQATSWTLREAVRFDRTAITSVDFDTYPILRFSEVPAVEVTIMPRAEDPPLGAGEAAHGPTSAAIANAIFDALGTRVRDLPITRERIVESMP